MEQRNEKDRKIVERIMERMKDDNGMRAHLTRADNPDTEHYSYRYLAAYWGREDGARERIAKESYQTVCASIARRRVEQNGSRSLIKELHRNYATDGLLDDKSPAHARLRRILACRTSQEANECIRPLLRLIESKEGLSIDYVQLLQDLIYFGDRVREKWAKEFYVYHTAGEDG